MPTWLDSWTNIRRPNQQDLAKRWATRNEPPVNPGQKVEMRPLRPDEAIPREFADPRKQAAFEAAYKDRRYLLRVPVDYDPATYPLS